MVKRRLICFAVIVLAALMLCSCAKKAPAPVVSPTPVPTPTPEPTPTPKPELILSTLGNYASGKVTHLAEFEGGDEIISSVVEGETGATGVFYVTNGSARLLCECGGTWTFKLVEGTEIYPCTLFEANFDYGGLDSFDKYTNALFMYEKKADVFSAYLTKPASNVVVPDTEYSHGLAWVLWGEYSDTNCDYMLPIDLENGSHRYANIAPFEGDELLFMDGINNLNTYVNARIALDENDPTVIYITKYLIDANGTESVVSTYKFSLFTKQFSKLS